jgi:hypothetical protein
MDLLPRMGMISMLGSERSRVAKIPLISVVDDDDSVRESLRALLRSVRFVVEVFASAEEFLR